MPLSFLNSVSLHKYVYDYYAAHYLTLHYLNYRKGQYKLPYNGENKKQAIVDFMRDPTTAMQQKKKEVVDDSWPEDSDVVHLTGEFRF